MRGRRGLLHHQGTLATVQRGVHGLAIPLRDPRCLDGVVLDADVNAACNILARLYDEEITLYMPYREVRALLAERIRAAVGTARPGLELRGRATPSPSTESELPAPVPKCTR